MILAISYVCANFRTALSELVRIFALYGFDYLISICFYSIFMILQLCLLARGKQLILYGQAR